MKVFELTTNFWKNPIKGFPKPLKMVTRKELWYVLFLGTALLFYVFQRILGNTTQQLEDNTLLMSNYNEQLKTNEVFTNKDSLIARKEREKLILAIEEKIVGHLYQIPDYSYITSLYPYLEYAPDLLAQIPSAVPLENGDYNLSSTYGHRLHPISKEVKKHYGIDLAAPMDKPVYASASGIVLKVIDSQKGYGTHIVLKHRFGFQTLYGHLNKVLVTRGQKVEQHELIATVGNTGASTGYHLHYEIIKNGLKINPIQSLDLKRNIYLRLMALNPRTKIKKNGKDR